MAPKEAAKTLCFFFENIGCNWFHCNMILCFEWTNAVIFLWSQPSAIGFDALQSLVCKIIDTVCWVYKFTCWNFKIYRTTTILSYVTINKIDCGCVLKFLTIA